MLPRILVEAICSRIVLVHDMLISRASSLLKTCMEATIPVWSFFYILRANLPPIQHKARC
jgi:hypothetical protein